MTDRERERVSTAATGWIDEAEVFERTARRRDKWQLLAARDHRLINRVLADERLNIVSELRAIFRRGTGRILFEGP